MFKSAQGISTAKFFDPKIHDRKFMGHDIRDSSEIIPHGMSPLYRIYVYTYILHNLYIHTLYCTYYIVYQIQYVTVCTYPICISYMYMDVLSSVYYDVFAWRTPNH